MTRLIAALSLMLSLVAGTALAQAYPPNEAGVTMGHWHMNSRDIEANKKIFVAMGGTWVKNGNFDIVKFPGVVVFLNQGPGVRHDARWFEDRNPGGQEPDDPNPPPSHPLLCCRIRYPQNPGLVCEGV